MFVEQVSWKVPRGYQASSLKLLTNVSQYMYESGGLLKALVGNVVDDEQNIVSVSFWKSWENLCGFLGEKKTPLLGSSSDKQLESLQRHHYEIVWEYPEGKVDTMDGADSWVLYDFAAEDEAQVESLLDELRHFGAKLSQRDNFREAMLWLDKSCSKHFVLATQWSRLPDTAAIAEPDKLQTQFKIKAGQLKTSVLALTRVAMDRIYNR